MAEMFAKNTRSMTSDSASVNMVSNGTSITGDVKSNSDFRVDGVMNGSLVVKGKLVVGPNGRIEGEIECQNADISGEIKGKVSVTELLMLRATAKINGDIYTGKISIEPDAQFTGSCSMGGVVKNIQHTHDSQPAGQKAAAQ